VHMTEISNPPEVAINSLKSWHGFR
jgi:hypothetical protein